MRGQGRREQPVRDADLTFHPGAPGHVVDHVRITSTFPEGRGTVEAIEIYEVKGGLITRVWFIFGAKALLER